MIIYSNRIITQAYYRTYSIAYNPSGTQTVNIYGMGSYTITPGIKFMHIRYTLLKLEIIMF